jgi:hypothetical protein
MFLKQLDTVKNESLLKKGPDQRKNMYRDLKRKEEEARKKKLEEEETSN